MNLRSQIKFLSAQYFDKTREIIGFITERQKKMLKISTPCWTRSHPENTRKTYIGKFCGSVMKQTINFSVYSEKTKYDSDEKT